MFRKSLFIFLIIILTASLCSCGRNTENKKEVEETTPAANNISPGVLKLANEAISTYDKYKNADISKEQAISKFKDLSEHIHDIKETLDDAYVYDFVDELYKKFDNERCDIENYKLPYEDLVDVLKGRYEPSEYIELQEVDDIEFCLSEDWKKNDDKHFVNTDGVILSVDSIEMSLLTDVEDLIKDLNSTEGYNWSISEDYDIYESRKLNFFYILNGSVNDNHVKIAYVQSINDKAYMFLFISGYPIEDSISDSELEEFLDQVWEIE